MMEKFQFMDGPWENADKPTIVRENPTGGDPIILGEFKRIYSSDALHELCRRANEADLCSDCPPETYITDATRCAPCPRRGWRTIETAPSGDHNAVIDMWASGHRYTNCRWAWPTYGGEKGVYGWVYQSAYDCDGPVDDWVPNPTHWMPLPEPPK